MVGINVAPHKPEALKEVMEKEDLNWRSFADDGSISRKWNSPPTPAFYILDHERVIRHKWIGHPGEHVNDAAVENLMQEVK